MKKFRNNGAVGALLDEYEKTILELKETITSVTNQQLTIIIDHKTRDPDCRSIQTILSHVIRAGYGYAIQVRKSLGEEIDYIDAKLLNSVEEYKKALNAMFTYNEQLFEEYSDLKIEEYDNEKKMLTRWGQLYDIEQLMEHAIVHVLRHRRQIERFLIEM
ncbi:DinB family protein [uncultured Aquimarina sp.]|uniref:DinB family protein n=1 Tax=uncultured Aquimarina sp. TaxID=575652 RepID=UPI0026144405|nr:DinB family protein [uncultured Aquimarina sp.]